MPSWQNPDFNEHIVRGRCSGAILSNNFLKGTGAMETALNPLELTRKLLSFNTINPPGMEQECAEYLGRILEAGGFKVAYYEFNEKRTSLIARMGSYSSKPSICFTGHVDTVPLGSAVWSMDPFSGEVDGDKLYGRGSSDMKSGVAAIVIAALSLSKFINATAGITLVITAGEETGSQGAYHLAGLGRALGGAGALVVAEPTSNYPLIGHKGSLWLKARTTGVTAHGAMPEQGVNAIYKAVQVVDRLQKFDFNVSPHPFIGAATLNVGTIAGGVNINSVPDQTTIGIDIRTIPGLANKEVFDNLQLHLGEEVELERIVDVDSVVTDSHDPWIQEVWDIGESFLNQRPIPRGAVYFTDASVLTPAFNNAPTVILGPGEPLMAHKTNEFCYISKIKESVEMYEQIAKKWCDI